MPRIYVSTDSYPEMREIRPGIARHLVWWRAFRSGARDRRLRVFGLVSALLLASAVMLSSGVPRLEVDAWVRGLGAVAAVAFWALLVVTWGGDLIRPHMRRASVDARASCPSCGHLLVSRIEGREDPVRCLECGVDVPRSVFEPPYPVPRRFLALPTWLPRSRRRAGRA